jgi:hypothetical protein
MKLFTGMILAAAGLASAHLGAMVFPLGGETVKAGATTMIKWTIDEQHAGGTDIGLSLDGKTWKTIGTVTSKSANTFSWTVPNSVSKTARIRICQKNGVPCTDADNVSKPGDNAPYVLVSANFTIQGSAGVLDRGTADAGAAVQVTPGLRNVNVSFAMDREGAAVLRAYDARGRLAATLLDARLEPGFHELSLFSNALDFSRPILLKLQAGERSSTTLWAGTP